MAATIGRRYTDSNYGFWNSSGGLAARYAIVVLVFGLVLLYFAGGRIHANRRVAQGKQPLAYHRWMVRGNNAYAPRPMNINGYYQNAPPPGTNNAYQMESWAPPPPAYGSADAPPPSYQPPQGGSKVAADQAFDATNRPAGEGSSAGANVTEPGAAAYRL